MTNALALARAAIPSHDWILIESTGAVISRYTSVVGNDDPTFNPRSIPWQFEEVLAWLLRQDKNNAIHSDVVRYVVEDGTGWSKRAEYHDGTAPSLVRAVVAAAERVAEDGKV